MDPGNELDHVYSQLLSRSQREITRTGLLRLRLVSGGTRLRDLVSNSSFISIPISSRNDVISKIVAELHLDLLECIQEKRVVLKS